jgi:ribosomal protein L6P/L9E
MVPATKEELQTREENAKRMRIAQDAEREKRVKHQQFRSIVNNMYKKAGV